MSKKNPARNKKRKRRLAEKFQEFIDSHSPLEMGRHLRIVFFDYLANLSETGLPCDFNIYVWEFNDLFELLDDAADEQKKNKVLQQS